MSEDARRASTETLRNAATAAPGEKVASLESADGAESVRAYDEDEIAHTVPCSCFAWSRERVRLCLCGCTSASIVLVVRLLLDWHSGTTYDVYVFSRAHPRRLDRSWDGQVQKMLMDVLIIPVF